MGMSCTVTPADHSLRCYTCTVDLFATKHRDTARIWIGSYLLIEASRVMAHNVHELENVTKYTNCPETPETPGQARCNCSELTLSILFSVLHTLKVETTKTVPVFESTFVILVSLEQAAHLVPMKLICRLLCLSATII